MEWLFYLLAAIFVVLALVSIVFVYARMIGKANKTQKGDNVEYDIELALEEIKKNESASAVANGFIRLLKNSYILVHLLINAGNQYDDEIQSELFNSSLTEDVLVALNSLEGKYE